MGREVKRVPLDFAHPMGERWPGFLSPKWRDCPNPDCRNGSTTAAAWLENWVSLLLLAGSDGASGGRWHPYFNDVHRVFHQRYPVAPKALVEISTGLAGRSPMGRMGHDACDRWSATKAIIKAAGLPEGWGTCKTCSGHAIHPDDLEASDKWEPTPPPNGSGWQMWETVSEGSPISPVFETPEGLARWLADTNASAFGNQGASYESWLGMIRAGWAPSAMSSPETGMISGVEAIGSEP